MTTVNDTKHQPCLIIGEAGVNHNGSVDLAHDLIDLAASAGADVVKFQTFDPAALVSERGRTAEYQRQSTGSDSQKAMLSQLALPHEAWNELADHCRERGIEFLSTAFDWASLESLVSIGLQRIKIPSGEIDNLPFIARAAGLGLPLIISTGMSTWAEVDAAVEHAAGAPAITLLHCVSSYPAPADSANLLVLPAMHERYSVPVGWSDHTIGERSAVMAVALGASVIEKHVTLDRTLPGPDHSASADPEQFHVYVDAIREAESMLGQPEKSRTAVEEETAAVARRSHHAARDLVAGAMIGESDTVLLRPATGTSASEVLVGRQLRAAVRSGEPITADVLEAGAGRG